MIYNGTLLSWAETKKIMDLIHDRGIEQFLSLHRRWKDRDGDPFKWGEEVTFSSFAIQCWLFNSDYSNVNYE